MTEGAQQAQQQPQAQAMLRSKSMLRNLRSGGCRAMALPTPGQWSQHFSMQRLT